MISATDAGIHLQTSTRVVQSRQKWRSARPELKGLLPSREAGRAAALLGDLNGVIDLNAEVTNGALAECSARFSGLIAGLTNSRRRVSGYFRIRVWVSRL